jgi:hypothetical protein
MNCSVSIRHPSCLRIDPPGRRGTLEKRAMEKQLAVRLSANEDLSLSNQELAEILRSRIQELNRRLAILKSGRTHARRGAAQSIIEEGRFQTKNPCFVKI